MVKFDMNPSLTQAKQVSVSQPTYASGGSHDTPKQGANASKPEKIVTSGGGTSGDFASAGGQVNVGKQTVKPAYPC